MIFHSAKKQHIKILIFVLVCVNFIFPPIFINFDETVFLHKWSFPLNSIIRTLAAYALLLFIKKENSVSLVKKMIQKEHRKDNIKYSFLTLIFLCAMSFCFSRFFAAKSFFLRPKSFLEFIYCILTFLCSAFFEETIYRIYLPHTLNEFLGISKSSQTFLQNSEKSSTKVSLASNKTFSSMQDKNIYKELYKSKALFVFAEFVCILLFSLAHRYLGLFSVLYAFIAGSALRYCYKKTESLAIVLVHFFYNLFAFLSLQF